MGTIVAAGIAIALSVVVALAAQRIQRRPPMWVVGLTVAALVFPILELSFGGEPEDEPPSDIPGMIRNRVLITDIDSGETHPLVKKSGYYTGCAWSPDGSRIAVPGTRLSDWSSGILLIDPETRDTTIVPTGDGSADAVSWSPDGERMAWWQPQLQGEVIEIGSLSEALVVAEVGGENQRELLSQDQASFRPPKWSPDGTRLAVTSWDVDGVITLVTVSDGASRDIQVGTGSVLGYAWSPDGKRLAASVFGGRGPSIYIVEADGSGSSKIVSQSGDEVAWSPDGKRIAYMTYGIERHEVWTVAPDGTTPRRLASLPAGTVGGLCWSPDGTKLALWAYLEEYPDIVVIDAGAREWRAVARIRTPEPITIDVAPAGPGEILEGLWRRVSPSAGPPVPVMANKSASYSRPEGFSWAPDSRQIAYITADPDARPARNLARNFDLPVILLFALAAPVALAVSVWTWLRRGTSATTVLCTIASAAPTAAWIFLAWVILEGIMRAGPIVIE